MGVPEEVGLTAARELRKNLRSAKGIALFALFVLGGLIVSIVQTLLFNALIEDVGLSKMQGSDLREIKLKVLEKTYDADLAAYLVDCPTNLHVLFKATFFFLPLVILLVGFDLVAGETQHRTFRYMVGRARRPSLIVGKALGVWGVISLMIAVLLLTVDIKTLAQGQEAFGPLATWSARLWLFLSFSAAPYVGLTTLLSSSFRGPIVALFVGLGTLCGLGLSHLILGISASTKPVTWAFPSQYDQWLLSPSPAHVAAALGFLLAWGAACVAIASEMMRRRDI